MYLFIFCFVCFVSEVMENDQTSSEMLSPVEEQPQYVYATNGYVDQTGAPPPGLYFINGKHTSSSLFKTMSTNWN